MPKITMLTASLLIVLGLGAYFGSGAGSVTAMIPAFFGLPMLGLGYLAQNDKWSMHAMHGAVLLGLIGLLGGFMGIPKLFSMLSGAEVERPFAAIVQSAMAVICGVYVATGVQSFIAARKQRQNGE